MADVDRDVDETINGTKNIEENFSLMPINKSTVYFLQDSQLGYNVYEIVTGRTLTCLFLASVTLWRRGLTVKVRPPISIR